MKGGKWYLTNPKIKLVESILGQFSSFSSNLLVIHSGNSKYSAAKGRVRQLLWRHFPHFFVVCLANEWVGRSDCDRELLFCNHGIAALSAAQPFFLIFLRRNECFAAFVNERFPSLHHWFWVRSVSTLFTRKLRKCGYACRLMNQFFSFSFLANGR